jgi:hypothetical protein
LRAPLITILLLTTGLDAQPYPYKCDYETRTAASKQTVDAATSEDGNYAYTLVVGKPLVWLLRSKPVIEWWGATNMSTSANGIVAQAFQDWEEESGIDFEKLGDSNNAVWPNEDGTSQMLVADPSDLRGAQASTQRFLDLASKVIETDIGLDPNLMAGSNDAFKVSIIRHEIGHLLGLQHVDRSNSLMFATILLGSAKSIDQGTLDGIEFLYGEPAGLRNLTVAYQDTLGTGIRTTPAENAAFEMAYSPERESVYASTALGTWNSVDGGASWAKADLILVEGATGVPFESGVPVANYRPAPDDPNTLYGTTNLVVHRSDNGGSTWTFLGGTPFVSSIDAFDIQSATTVFIGTNLGVYKTIDSGDNWVQLNSGLPEGILIGALARDPTQTATMFVGGIGGVYKTTNGGINWSKVGVGLGATSVRDITVDAQGVVYAVSDIGAFKLSSDESTWEPVNSELGTYQVYDVLVDPVDTWNILVATREGIFRSADRGISFTQVFPFDAPAIVVPLDGLTLGDFEVGQTATRTLVIQNTGPGPLVISRVETDVDGMTVSETPVTIQPGASTPLQFRMSRDSEGIVTGSVTLITNDPENPQVFIEILGTGIIILADARADFDGSGAVDFTDFLGFASAFGTTDATYDIDASGTVDFTDFLVFASSFGRPLN